MGERCNGALQSNTSINIYKYVVVVPSFYTEYLILLSQHFLHKHRWLLEGQGGE